MNATMTAMEQKVYDLVKEQYGKMIFSTKYSNQVILANKCQEIIYSEWGISGDGLWKMVDKYVAEFIPDDMD